MVSEFLSYTQSIFNPLIKLVALLLFAISVYLFYRCRIIYGGKLQEIATLLLLGGIAGVLASAFRIAGDSFVAWKWGESACFLALAVITLMIAFFVRMKFRNIIALFESIPGDEQK